MSTTDGPAAGTALALEPETLRRLGYALIDRLVDHHRDLPSLPVAPPAAAEALLERFAQPLPADPTDAAEVFERIFEEVLPQMAHVQHPRFFGFVPGVSNSVAVLSDLLTSGWNVFAGTWYAGSGAIALERTVIGWLRDICGMPEQAGGVLVSGGSMANLTALAAARAHRYGGHDMRAAARAVIYTGDQTHTAVSRALRVLGFGEDQLRTIATDETFRLPPADVAKAIEQDRRRGLTPFAVVASAGTTNTGAVDPLDDLADLCQDAELWLHVDGAYGAPANMTARGMSLLSGLGRADSLALDPHKWLFQPFEIGCTLMREARHLEQAFAVHPEFLRDVPRDVVNPADQGVQLTRSFRALKLWATFQVFGGDAIAAAIDRGIDLAVRAQSLLEATGAWSIVTPACLGIVTFRYRDPERSEADLDRLHGEVLEALRRDGSAATTSTVLRGRTVLRLCPINPRTSDIDLERTVERLTVLARQLGTPAAASQGG